MRRLSCTGLRPVVATCIPLLLLLMLVGVRMQNGSDSENPYECLLTSRTSDGVLDDNVMAQLRGPAPSKRIMCHRYQSHHQNRSTGLLLAAFLPLYKGEHESARSSECVLPRHSLMVQLVEAVHLIMDDQARESSHFAQLIDGIEILDTCGLTQVTMESVAKVNTRSSLSHQICPNPFTGGAGNSAGDCRDPTQRYEARIAAALGPALSKELDAASPVLSVHQLPHFSYWSTSNDLYAKTDFPYLFRTATMDQFASAAIVDILDHYKWNYIGVIQGEDTVTRANMADDVKIMMHRREICLAFNYMFRRKDVAKMEAIAQRLVDPPARQHLHPTVVVAIAGYLYMEDLFGVIKDIALRNSTFARKLAATHLVWIGNDGWLFKAVDILPFTSSCNPDSMSFGYHSFIGPAFKVIKDFVPHSTAFNKRLVHHLEELRVTPQAVQKNPWLAVAWQDRFNCCLAFLPPVAGCRPCPTDGPVADIYQSLAQPISSGSLWLAMNAVVRSVAQAYSSLPANRQDLFSVSGKKVLGVARSLTMPCGDSPTRVCQVFTDNQDPLAAFSIHAILFENCARELREIGYWSGEGHPVIQPGKVLIEEWSDADGEGPSIWATNATETPLSVCSLPCGNGQVAMRDSAMSPLGWSGCCWTCKDCPADRYSENDTCVACPDGLVVDANRTKCISLRKVFYTYSNTAVQAIIVVDFVSFGFAICVGLIFFANRMQAQVLQAGVGQSILLLGIVLVGCGNVIFLYAEPSVGYCTACHLSIPAVLTIFNSLLLSRSLRLIAFTSKALDISPWIHKLAIYSATSFPRQVMTVAVQCSISFLILGLCGGLAPSYVSKERNIQDEEQYVRCTISLPLMVVACGILFLQLVFLLVLAVKSRQFILDLSLDDKEDSGGSREGNLLFLLSLTLATLDVSLLLTFLLTPGVTQSIAFGVGMLLELDGAVGFIFLPRVISVVTWNRMGPSERRDRVMRRLAIQRRDRAREMSQHSRTSALSRQMSRKSHKRPLSKASSRYLVCPVLQLPSDSMYMSAHHTSPATILSSGSFRNGSVISQHFSGQESPMPESSSLVQQVCEHPMNGSTTQICDERISAFFDAPPRTREPRRGRFKSGPFELWELSL